MLPVALTIPAVVILPPITLAVALSVVLLTTLAPVILPPDPVVEMLPPVMLPVTDTSPVTYSPVVAHTTTLLVPPIPAVILLPELTTVILLVPLLIFELLVLTPVSNEPLPKI